MVNYKSTMDPDDNSASIASNSYSYNKESTHSNSNSFETKMNGDPPQSTRNGYRSGSNNNTSSRNHRNHRDHYRDQYRDEPRNNYSNGGQHRKTSTTKRSDQYGDTTNQNKNRQRSKSSTRRRDHDKEKYSSYDESDNNNHPRKFNDNVDNDDNVTHLRSLSTMDTKTFRRLRENRREIIGINGGGDSRRRRGVGGSSNSVFSYDTRDTAGSSGTSATPINGNLLRSSSRGGRGWSRRSKRNSNTTTSSRRYLPWQAVIIIGLGIVTLIKTGLIELKLENHTRLLLNGEKEIDLQNYLRGVPQLITGGKIGGGSSRTLESQIVNNEEYFAEPNIGDSKDWGSEVDGTGSRDSLEALDTLDDDGEDKKGKDEFGYAAVVGGGSPSSLSYQSPSQGMVGSSLGSSSSQGYNQPTYSNQLQQGAGSSSQQYGNQGFVSQGGGVPIQNYGVASPLLAAADVNQFTQQQQQQQQYGDDGSQQQQQELSAEERLERYKAGNIGGFGSQGGEENTLSSNGSSGNNNAIKGYESGGDSELYFRQALQKTIQHMDRPQIDVEEEDASSFVHPAESNYIIEGEEAESNYKLQAQLKREGEMDVASLGKSAQRQPINGKFENLYSEQREVARMGAINLGFIPPPQQSEGGGTGEDEIDPSAPMTPELLREINKKARTNDRLQTIAQQKLLSAYGGGGEVNGGDATTDDSAKTVSALLNAIENENGMKFDTSDPEKLREQIKAQLKENRVNLEELEGKEEKTHRLKRHHLKRHQNQLYELREELLLAPHAEPIPTVGGKTMADDVGIKADASENGGLTPEEEEEIIRAKKIKDQVARRRQRKINQIKANKKKAAEEKKAQLEKSEIGDQVSQGQDQQPNDTADASNVKEEVDENLASVQTAETPQQTDPVPQGQDRQLNDTVEGSIVKEEVAENPATVQGAETPQQIDPVPQGQDPQPNDTADGGTVKEEVAEIPALVQTAETPQQVDPVPQGQDLQPSTTADGGTVKEEVAEIPAPVQTAEIPQQIDPVPQGQDPQPNAIADGASDIEKLAENPAPELSAETPQQIDLAPLGQDPQPNTNAIVVNPAPAQSDGTPPQRSVVDGLSDNDPRLWGVTG